MLQNKITPKRYLEILENSKAKHSKHCSKHKRERLENKFSFIVDILEIDISYDINELNYNTLKNLTDKLVKEIFKYEELKNQLMRRYISNRVSSTVATTIRDKDLLKFCEVLSYTISEYDFKLLK